MHSSTARLSTLVALIVGTIAGIAGTVAAYSVRGARTTPADYANETHDPPQDIHVAETTIAPQRVDSPEADLELAAALARIDELYAERERDWQQTAAWVETLLDSRKLESSSRLAQLDHFKRKLEIRKQAESGRMLAGIDDAVMLLFATLLAGDEAIQDLCDVAADEALSLEAREEALQALGYLPSELSLRILLNPPADFAADPNYDPEPEKLAFMVEFLAPEIVTPHAETLYRIAADALNTNAQDDSAWGLVAALAFEHHDANALKLMNDSRTMRYYGEDLLQIAWWAGTDTSRAYIERMSRTHPTLEIRRQASEILAGWPEN